MINKEEARVIAFRYIEEAEAIAGIPRLKEISENVVVYIVPILVNDVPNEEIYIDSKTGDDLGGAGC